MHTLHGHMNEIVTNVNCPLQDWMFCLMLRVLALYCLTYAFWLFASTSEVSSINKMFSSRRKV